MANLTDFELNGENKSLGEAVAAMTFLSLRKSDILNTRPLRGDQCTVLLTIVQMKITGEGRFFWREGRFCLKILQVRTGDVYAPRK